MPSETNILTMPHNGNDNTVAVVNFLQDLNFSHNILAKSVLTKSHSA